ncbi:MAG: hypothetical protein QM723_26520 [Myxococcaceae bacterium]
MRHAILALTVFALGCNNGSSTDGGTDSGTDAGTDAGNDAGMDAGVCARGVWTDGSGDGYRAPSASTDGVLGFASHVQQWATLDYNTAMPAPTACIDVTISDPDGQPVQSAITRQSAVVDVSFVPSKLGVHHVVMAIDGGPVFQNDVAVYPVDAPDLVLPRACGSVVWANGVLGCDEALFALDGGAVASLPGGLWLAAGEDLLAWVDGGLSYAALDDAGTTFGAAVSSPLPESFSASARVLAIGNSAGGALFTRDGGSLTAVGSLDAGFVNVFADDVPHVFQVNVFDSPEGLVYSAGADRVVTWIGLNTINGGSMHCLVSDGAGGLMESAGCDPYFSPRLFHLESSSWRLPRRSLAQTAHGVRLPDGGAMYLADAGQITDDDRIVWQSSENQTAIWFR